MYHVFYFYLFPRSNCMNTILAFAQVKTITGTAWQQSMYKAILLAAVVVYFAACLVAYRIYSELRLSLPEDPAHAEAGYDPYGGLVNQAAGAAEERQPQQQQRNAPNSYAAQPAAASSSSASTTSGFRPFTGTGYRLGSA
jgi:hypothetical protein